MLAAFRMLFGSTPASFGSVFSLDDSVRRLAEATTRSLMSTLVRQTAYGRVSASKVSLQRSIPFVHNSFKPQFVGRFEATGNRVTLVCRFTMAWWVKVFMGFWFGFVLLMTLLTCVAAVLQALERWYFFFVGPAFLAGGLALVALGKWFARNDESWLSAVITSALGGTVEV